MPRRIGGPKRRGRIDPATECLAWHSVFACGHDFAGGLLAQGLDSWHDRADFNAGELRAAAADAWSRLGRLWLATFAEPDLGPPWALTTFGDPSNSRG
jgi:hypothetical protein